ncbi:MAG: cbb3-type cytochrome c oxidase subunit 3 [Thiolinea sp.]
MDYNDLRGITTALALLAFLGVVFWAYSRRRKNRFDQAANSIFDPQEEQVHGASVKEVEQ